MPNSHAHRPVVDTTRAHHRAPYGTADLSPLGVARSAFMQLATGSDPLALDTTPYPGLPDRMVPLSDLRSRLLSRSCPPPTRDAVWRELVTRSREHGGQWTIGCVGLALPALTTLASELSARFAGDRSDVHAEVLRGFLAGLATIDLDRRAIMTRLRWTAYRAGHAALREALTAPTPFGDSYHSAAPPAPFGHPDLVLVRAITARVITPVEADLIGATRLEHLRLRAWASDHGVGYEAARKARQRAERRLVSWLLDEASTNDGEHGRFVRRAAPPTPQTRLRLVTPAVNLASTATGTDADEVSRIGERTGVQVCGRTLHPTYHHPEASRCA
jgi:hypothetical protein